MVISFHSRAEEPGVDIVDSIENRTVRLHLSDEPDLRPASTTGRFLFPVDAARTVTSETIRILCVPEGYVRDTDGTALLNVEPGIDDRLPEGTYVVELGTSIKLYLRIQGPVTVSAELDHLVFEQEGSGPVEIGARSYHDHPAATVTTTEDPTDLLSAVSTFGSALKTTSCERSFPTLRGHPPTLRVGDELSVPDSLSTPDTGVRLELPATRRAAFVAAPLAHYLGADCVPADEPRLVTDVGFSHDLDSERGFESEVARVLKQVFFLDCLTRTEGLYEVNLHERTALEPALDFDFAALYEAPLARQVETYLSVPFDVVEPQLPRWKLTADVAPTPENVSVLPYLVDDLAVVREADAESISPEEVRSTVVHEYVNATDDGIRSRSADDPAEGASETQVVRPPPADSVEQVWFDDGIPHGATKGVEAAYRHRLARTTSDGSVDIVVVGNGTVGEEERSVVDDVYGRREDLPFDVTFRRSLSTAELADVLETESDFLHYVGHIDDSGFRCPDGTLDVQSVETVGARAFLLNTCRSYWHGLELVEKGSIGGIVTVTDVLDSGAVRVGMTLARLLHLGFPLQPAFAIARAESVVGGHYLVVGDGSIDVVQDRDGVPVICDAVETDEEVSTYDLTITAALPAEGGLGILAHPYLESSDESYLPPGRLATFRVDDDELREYVRGYGIPMRLQGDLYWTDEADPFG